MREREPAKGWSRQGVGDLGLRGLAGKASGGRGDECQGAKGQGSEPSCPPGSARRTLSPLCPGRGSPGLLPKSRLIDPPQSPELVPTSAPRAAACFLVSDCKQI